MKTNNFKYGALIVIIGMLIFPLVMPKIFKKMIPVGVRKAVINHFEIKTTTIVQNMDTARIEKLDRESIANLYLTGNGIEIGALHLPLKVPPSASVKYVDILPKSELEKHYPELLKDYELVEVDIVDDGEYLIKIQNSSLNFVIACHFLEHCQNPIAAIENFLRVLKPGGILYLAVPDKRYTFDKDRPITSFEHLLKDYEEGPDGSRKEHFREWVTMVNKTEGEEAIEKEITHLMNMNYSIHYNVWRQIDLLDFFVKLKQDMEFQFNIELVFQRDQRENEVVVILKKN